MRNVEQFSQDFKNTFVLGTKEYKKKPGKQYQKVSFLLLRM